MSRVRHREWAQSAARTKGLVLQSEVGHSRAAATVWCHSDWLQRKEDTVPDPWSYGGRIWISAACGMEKDSFYFLLVNTLLRHNWHAADDTYLKFIIRSVLTRDTFETITPTWTVPVSPKALLVPLGKPFLPPFAIPRQPRICCPSLQMSFPCPFLLEWTLECVCVCLPGNCPFHPSCWLCGHKAVHYHFSIWWICTGVSESSLPWLIISSSFSCSSSVWLEASQFYWSFQRTLFWFHWLCLCFCFWLGWFLLFTFFSFPRFNLLCFFLLLGGNWYNSFETSISRFSAE